MKKVVLAFSGGLDTSYCAIYLSKEMGLEVHAALANTGGFSAEELASIEKRAYDLGVKSYVALDVTQDYYQHAIKYMIFGNVLKNGTYPISVSSERISQATAIAKYAEKSAPTTFATAAPGPVTTRCASTWCSTSSLRRSR